MCVHMHCAEVDETNERPFFVSQQEHCTVARPLSHKSAFVRADDAVADHDERRQRTVALSMPCEPGSKS